MKFVVIAALTLTLLTVAGPRSVYRMRVTKPIARTTTRD
jgi:hypothetical protein